MTDTDHGLTVEPVTRTQQFVAGFLVCPETDEVVLIRKNRPAWQAGKLNGVGGKVEPGETPADAMRREFCEETGVDIDDWDPMLALKWAGGDVHFFRRCAPVEVLEECTTVEDETILTVSIPRLLAREYPMIPNLRWLVPLAAYQHDTYGHFTVAEVDEPVPAGVAQ